ncbi:C40 family peptidase [Amycolatopsis sp. H20-H5]|uniref:C40 family peptidase n=1 Tax=Amycolatopsis sp. H20-H5 TaxID=3046309 RepID=UPI002DBC8CAB|nr:C40 family peptidase [Amycolatopsis sp. H20-H5]MEC3978102.1 C40 family peptidase [Amycolatopsis sp. H20-H5]
MTTEPQPEATAKKSGWARGALTRGLVALPLVAGLVTAGWLLNGGNDRPSTAAVPIQAPTPAADTIGGGAGPSVLEVSAPVQAQQAPAKGVKPLEEWANKLAGPLDIPASALMGYANGELALRGEQPKCHLSWVTLAGIGAANSNHGRGGDQQRGPLGLSAQQWKKWGANIPGIAKPAITNPDAASVAAGRALCAGGTDLGGGNGWWNAVASYKDAKAGNATELFRQQVLGNAQLFSTLSLDPSRAATPSVRATRFALGQLGLPYVWGGNGPDAGAAGFDCSGLTKASYDDAGVALPRTADSQFRALPPVPAAEQPKLGDLVFYGNPATRIHHVGLYLGNGLMINAPTEGQAVQIHTYHSKGDDYVGAGRPSN